MGCAMHRSGRKRRIHQPSQIEGRTTIICTADSSSAEKRPKLLYGQTRTKNRSGGLEPCSRSTGDFLQGLHHYLERSGSTGRSDSAKRDSSGTVLELPLQLQR